MIETVSQGNRAGFRRLIEQGFSEGDAGLLDELLSDDFVEHQYGIQPPDREGVKGTIAFLHNLAPDFSLKVEAMTDDGDLVWGRMTARGTHTGPGLGEPSGRPFEITVMDLCRFQDGRIVEHWGVADRFAQMIQLGMKPARPAGAGS